MVEPRFQAFESSSALDLTGCPQQDAWVFKEFILQARPITPARILLVCGLTGKNHVLHLILDATVQLSSNLALDSMIHTCQE